MNNKKTVWIIILIAVASTMGYLAYKKTKINEKPLFKTEVFKKRHIEQVINATGAIEAENTIKVGSLINGVVKELLVEENEQVKKGQTLAIIDNGKDDTDVKRTAGLVTSAKANLAYAKAFYNRQTLMFEKGNISKNELDLAESQYGQALGQLEEREAAHEQAVIEYRNTKILSPIDGVVIKQNVSLGEGISSFLMPTVIYTIAQDLTKMKIELEVDETAIGDLKIGAQALLTFDTYPNKEFIGAIKEISNGPTISKGTVSYKSYIYIDNAHMLLKPGMTVHADIIVAEKKDIFAVPGYIFSINSKLIKALAEEKKYGYKPVTPEELASFKNRMANKEDTIKTVWTFKNKTFTQKPVELGITDKIYFEIVSGLNEDETIVVDIEETDIMKEMFKRLFGGGLSK